MEAKTQRVRFHGHQIHIWRDDLYGVEVGQQLFSGNKARKLGHYLRRDFPGIKRLVSYGSAQSNMLLSLAQLTFIKGWKLEFYVDHIPDNLKQNPRGNYAMALSLGAHVIEVMNTGANTEQWVQDQGFEHQRETLVIPEGGRAPESEEGIAVLAAEIQQWVEVNKLRPISIMLPSGTGTTAFFLQKYLDLTVLTCACVGDSAYLQKQFESLLQSSTRQSAHQYPRILKTDRKYHFGQLYPEFYQIWKELLDQTGIEFDLLYDPLGWLSLKQYLKQSDPMQGILYIHQGGLLGNSTMKERYLRKQDRD